MKSIMKLFPAALTVLALASCSDIDQPGLEGKSAPIEEGDLIVTVDPMDYEGVTTRAYRNVGFTTLDFVEGDTLNVYDADLYKHDVYAADATGKFKIFNGPAKLDAPQFALFPGNEVVRGYWNYDDDMVYAEFQIDPVQVYDDKSEKVIDAAGNVGYKVNLPMWGVARKDGEQVKATLRYLTAILQINLKNAFGNANWLRLSNGAGKPLSGTFRAKLDAEGAPNAWADAAKTQYTNYGAVKLEKGLDDLKTNDYILIDLRKVPSDASCIFLPVIEGLDGDLDDIKLEYTAYNGEAETINTVSVREQDDPNWSSAANNAKWVDTGCYFYGEEFIHNKKITCGYNFALEDVSPNSISYMLNQYKTTGSDITLDLVKKFTMDADASIVFDGSIDYSRIDLNQAGHIIAIPALNDGVDININLTKKNDTEKFSTWTNTYGNQLIIQDADPANPFKGTITFNVGDYANLFTAGNAGIKVNLPEANFVIVGDYTTADTNNLTLEAAKKVYIGDGKTATKLGVSNMRIYDGTNFGVIGNVNDFIISNKAEYTDATNGLKTTANNTNVTVTGSLVITGKTLDMSSSVKGLLTIDATPADATDKVVDGNVTINGNAVVALGAEGEAVSGTFKMQGVKKTLSYKAGLINTIEVDLNNTVGQWEQDYVTIKLDELVTKADGSSNSVAEFLTLKETKGHANFTESLWSGAKITNTNYKDKWTVVGGANAVYTASQLASITAIGGGDPTLNNDLNLNNKAWTGYKVKTSFTGADISTTRAVANSETKYPVISNLIVKNGSGLFTETIDAMTISNLTFNGVTGAPTADATTGIGALLAEVKHATTITNVNVKGLNIVAGVYPSTHAKAGQFVEMQNVGGLVGINTAALTLNKVSAAGTITGYANLGGFVGKASEDVTAGTATDGSTTCTSSVALSANYVSGLAMDMNYARMGGFIGTVTDSKNVTIADGSSTTSSITGKSEAMYLSNSTAGDGNFFNYTQDQKFIGFSGTYKHGTWSATNKYGQAYGTIKILGKTYVEPLFGDALKHQITGVNLGVKVGGIDNTKLAPLYHFIAK